MSQQPILNITGSVSGSTSNGESVINITATGGGGANDTAYGVGWDGVADQTPSQNAVYDVISGLGGGHNAVTLTTEADTVLSLSTQLIGFDTQAVNTFFAGPLTGSSTGPAFRIMGDADIPSTITRDIEWDTAAKINAATTDNDFVISADNITMSNATWLGTGAATSRIAFTNQTSMSILNTTFSIGTTNPDYPYGLLDVNKDGTTNANTNLTGSGIVVRRDTEWIALRQKGANAGIGGVTYPGQVIFSGGGAGEIYTQDAIPLVFGVNSTEKMRIDVNGAVNATQINRNGYTVLGKDNTTADLAELTNLYYTTARTRADVNATAPLTLTTGTFAIPKATSAADGYLNKTDWTTFNNSIDTEVDPTVDTSAEILAIIGNYAIPGIRITNGTINSTQITDYSIVAADVTNYTLTGTQINNASNITVNTLTATGGTGVSSFTGPDDGVTVTVSINAASAAVTAADTFINFNSTAGAIGSIAGTAVSGVVAYNTMTFSHYTQVIDKTNIEPSMLLEIVEGKPDFNKKQLFKTRICRTKKSKQAIGTFGGTNKDGYDLCLAGGTAFVFVKNTGRNIGIGDLFYSSDMPGCVELQNDNTLHSYTVAKATEPIRWEKGEIKRLISCILLGG